MRDRGRSSFTRVSSRLHNATTRRPLYRSIADGSSLGVELHVCVTSDFAVLSSILGAKSSPVETAMRFTIKPYLKSIVNAVSSQRRQKCYGAVHARTLAFPDPHVIIAEIVLPLFLITLGMASSSEPQIPPCNSLWVTVRSTTSALPLLYWLYSVTHR